MNYLLLDSVDIKLDNQLPDVDAIVDGFDIKQQKWKAAADASPTLIVACEKDTIAANKQHSDIFYASLSPTLPRAEIEVRGASHLCATFLASKAQLNTMGKASVAWLKRFLDNDLRYDAMVKGGIDEGEFSRFDVQGF